MKKSKIPSLSVGQNYYRATVTRPSGKRTTVSFGHIADRRKMEVLAALEQWWEIYQEDPETTLSHSSPYEAIEKYHNPHSGMTVEEILEHYERWLIKQGAVTKVGTEHPRITNFKRVKKYMASYQGWQAARFGPDQLLQIQQAINEDTYTVPKWVETENGREKMQIEKHYSRRTVNDVVNMIGKMWRWAAGREFVKYSATIALEEVKSIRYAQGNANEKVNRATVTWEELQLVMNSVTSVVADMMALQWHTGMRPGEVCKMRPVDIKQDDENCWLYIPGSDASPVGDHKTAWHKRVRVIPLAGAAQHIVARRMEGKNPKDYLFSPVDAVEEMKKRRYLERTTPMSCGNREGTNVKEHPMLKPGKCYDSHALNVAIKRGCKLAGVDRFTPYDLRRTAATNTRSKLGKTAAQVLLGHVDVGTTDIYLLEEVKEAMKVAKKLQE
ncbi:tyrosine-type recombinase/integrase [Poriferisphaera sp. WC338]|uniref:tyrosine-type recombinase/integrase n=1 Tax=Poriferisphaera sp. WC338 TaxID=3425129 RepID=UPI003D817805